MNYTFFKEVLNCITSTVNGITTISASAFATGGSRFENIYGKSSGTHDGSQAQVRVRNAEMLFT